eukprot:10047809-Alexandrium_andersonii.AAC.1
MSASLVGSEMCIRDSLGGLALVARESPGVAEVLDDPALTLPDELEEPVSYTHLTLPTICSV